MRQTVDRSQIAGAVKAEVFVGWTARGWRWDITFYEIRPPRSLETNELGIQGRWHLGGDCGYARSRRAAWRAIDKAYKRYPRTVV